MTVTLRDYQRRALDDVRASYAGGHRAPLLVMATGGGKTVTFAAVAFGSMQRGRRTLIVAHRRELIRQASRKLADAGVPHGIIAPGHTATRDTVQVGSVQTLARRLDRLEPFDLIVIDEAHHSVAGGYSQLIAAQPRAKLLGVTATPERMDGRGLGVSSGGPFDDMILGPDVAELTTLGFLSPARVFAPADRPNLSGVRTRGGDYEAGALANAMDIPTLTGDAVAHYRTHADGLPAIAFCVSVEHARNVAATFRAAGYRAVAADGTMAMPERDAAISGLETGAVQVLCVCDLVSEGLDVPAVAAVIKLRPTQSLGLNMQQDGRGLRTSAGKDCLIILDHAGNTLIHGLPDTPRQWSLNGRSKRERDAIPAVWRCPACYACQAPTRVCRVCGVAAVDVAERRDPRALQQVDGELVAVDPARIERLRNAPLPELTAAARSRAELAEIARARGFKPGWAWHAWNERMQRRGRAA